MIDAPRQIRIFVPVAELNLVPDMRRSLLRVPIACYRPFRARGVANRYSAVSSESKPPVELEIEIGVLLASVEPGLILALLADVLLPDQNPVAAKRPRSITDGFPLG